MVMCVDSALIWENLWAKVLQLFVKFDFTLAALSLAQIDEMSCENSQSTHIVCIT